MRHARATSLQLQPLELSMEISTGIAGTRVDEQLRDGVDTHAASYPIRSLRYGAMASRNTCGTGTGRGGHSRVVVTSTR